MNRIRGGATLLLASFALALSGSAAFAQSSDGIFDTIKGMVGDPALGSMLMSKFASPSAILGGASSGPNNGSAPGANGMYNNSSAAYGSNFVPMPSGADPYSPNNYSNGFPPNASGAASPAYGFASPQPPQQNRGGFAAATGALASLATNYFNANANSNSSSSGGIGQVIGALGFGNINTPIAPSPVNNNAGSFATREFSPQPESGSVPGSDVSFSMRIAPAELRQLSRYDISVLIDKSGSMNTRDCPAIFGMGQNISRWEWCREQSSMLSEQTAGAFPAGITLVPFASNFQRFDNVRPDGINSIFNTSAPGGSTNLAGALEAEIGRYLQERDTGARRRPLMIAVITDGVPDSKSAVRRVIREASENMREPGEIRIVFFMIGQDQGGANFVDGLSDVLGRDGRNFNIVSEHTFAEVNQLGLARSLAFSAIQ